MAQPKVRLRVMARLVAGWTYSEVADDLGLSTYRVSQIADHFEQEANETDPDEMLLSEFISGAADLFAEGDMSFG